MELGNTVYLMGDVSQIYFAAIVTGCNKSHIFPSYHLHSRNRIFVVILIPERIMMSFPHDPKQI